MHVRYDNISYQCLPCTKKILPIPIGIWTKTWWTWGGRNGYWWCSISYGSVNTIAFFYLHPELGVAALPAGTLFVNPLFRISSGKERRHAIMCIVLCTLRTTDAKRHDWFQNSDAILRFSQTQTPSKCAGPFHLACMYFFTGPTAPIHACVEASRSPSPPRATGGT